MFYLVKLVKNTKGQYADPVITKHSTLKGAVVAFHDTCKILNSANDVALATVEVMTETGVVLKQYSEIITAEPVPDTTGEES